MSTFLNGFLCYMFSSDLRDDQVAKSVKRKLFSTKDGWKLQVCNGPKGHRQVVEYHG